MCFQGNQKIIMKTNKSNILPGLVTAAALLLMVVNVEAIVITALVIGLFAIVFCDYREPVQLAPIGEARPIPMPEQSLPMAA
jgi:hypothetical protein